MSDNQNPLAATTIKNAAKIIERFGGIRPMSTKTGVPVTTIQGWKQRDAIPVNRVPDLLAIAKQLGIGLGDLIPVEDKVAPVENGSTEPSETSQKREEIVVPVYRSKPAAPPAYPEQNVKTILIVAGIVILAAAALGVVFAIAPEVHKLTDQEERVRMLEAKIAEMDRQAAELAAQSNPPAYEKALSEIQDKVGDLTAEAKSYANIVNDLKSGTLPQRLAALEGQVGQILEKSSASGLKDMMQKVELMQSSAEGQIQLEDVVSSLFTATQPSTDGGTQHATNDIVSLLDGLRKTDPQVAETFKDVAPQDMKAAVMLLGMAQLRSSLARDNKSFDKDLALLKSTVAADDPELQQAIDRMAPNSKSGVLTPSGLSKELRGLTGDIVEASIMGNDISVKEKALTRLGQMVQVEKDGKQISGNQTQIQISEAQNLLDQGDVAAAIMLLQKLDGPTAERLKGFLQKAQATLMAGELKGMLDQSILTKIQSMGGAGSASIPYTTQAGDAGAVPDVIKNIPSNLMQGHSP